MSATPKEHHEKKNTPLRVALAGNPNCGKTTLFNALTGLHHKVANYPGVTVEKKEGVCALESLSGDPALSVSIIDLPGIYHLHGSSLDENIATQFLCGQLDSDPAPDLILSIVDASNLERNLYLTTQLMDLGYPIIVVLNMIDVAHDRGLTIKEELLARYLGVPVIPLVARSRQGISDLQNQIYRSLHTEARRGHASPWCERSPRYRELASRLGERQLERLDSPGVALVMGSALLHDSLEPSTPEIASEVEIARKTLEAQSVDPYSFEATARYRWINELVQKCCAQEATKHTSLGARLDPCLTHPIWGMLIFLWIIGTIFQAIFLWAEIPMQLIDQVIALLAGTISPWMSEGPLKSLLIQGVIPGVGSVLIFVPQIAVLFFFLGLLEDSGYLSRAAFLMDRVMRKVGLQGRSFIPLLSSFACAIPGIMSTRTIPSFADRMITILIAPLMSCSARLPVFTLLIAAFIPRITVGGIFSLQGLVLLAMYVLGVVSAAVVAWCLKLSLFRGAPALFVMEMPAFRAPSLKVVCREVWDRIIAFLKGAGTVILASSIVLWFIASYPAGSIDQSIAGSLGRLINPILAPLGFTWEMTVAIIASFAAREVFVSSLATVYHLEAGSDATGSLIHLLQAKNASGEFSLSTALALMVFYVYACQCMSTLAVCRRETNSWRWPFFMFSYMTGLAYIMAFITYRAALLLFGN